MLSSEEFLYLEQESVLLIEERIRKDIIIGAPHHSPGGIKNLPCPEHPDADENSGFIARQIAEGLNLSSIIACNYRIDCNKILYSDYSRQIANWTPKYLIEIHGHGAKSIPDDLIEISAGKAELNEFSLKFATCLQSKMNNHKHLKKYKVLGDFELVYFKGTKSATITDNRWTSLQIEIPPSLRLNPPDKSLPLLTALLIEFLQDTITEVCL